MVGYPGETKEDIRETIKLIRKCKFDSIIMGRFIPFPGTPVFDELVRNGDIPNDYSPPQSFKLFLPFQKKTEQKIYTPDSLEKFSLFRLVLRENIFLALRNPSSVLYFIKYYGIMNFMKKMYFLFRK